MTVSSGILFREACKYIQEHLSVSTDEIGTDSFLNVAKTSMSSKLVGVDSEFFAEMIVNAATAVKRTNTKGEVKIPVKAVNVLKAHGGNMKQSTLVGGYALNCTVACEGEFDRLCKVNYDIFPWYLII